MMDATFGQDRRCSYMEDALHPESVTRSPVVLVVEDEPLLLMLYEDAGIEAGADVVTAMTVSEGLAALDGVVDVAILDIRLGDGEKVFPVARRLMDAGIPFLFCSGTAYDMPEGEFKAVTIMSKPVAAQTVMAAAMILAARSEARLATPGPSS